VNDGKNTMPGEPTSAVLVKVLRGNAPEGEKRFTATFYIGRIKECDLQLKDDCISRNHLLVVFDGQQWLLKDQGSANGTYLNGERIHEAPLPDKAQIELGEGGPLLDFTIERPQPPKGKETMSITRDLTSETEIIKHYFDKKGTEKIGEQTLMFRRAFERAHKKKSRKYWVAIGLSLLFLITSAGFIAYQKNKINKFKLTAESIFYDMKSLELQISKLEDLMQASMNTHQVNELQAKRRKLSEMEKNYDNFVKELGIYGKLTEQERVIYRMARVFGECEINMPADFAKEVMNYVNKWKATNRLRDGLERAKIHGYAPVIVKALNENYLPPQYFFLALQESGFNNHAVGPLTRFGYAKGIWQFIPMTADMHNLKVGPLFAKPVYDPLDDRFHFEKATKAAARYLKYINNTEAQASGLLVMASYNWGAERVIKAIREMPQNPRERNFWRLLAIKSIPSVTYDYVFYIFSACVICENPGLFGFDGACPYLKKGY
jgi:membrane-bound lytic murein transglycosylase D